MTVPTEFTSFGAYLKYLRRRAQLTQTELAIACGYSPSHISHLENNQRLPDRATLLALFVPALSLEDEPALVERLLALAASQRTESGTRGGPSWGVTSGKRPQNQLPAQVTPFVGRGTELEALARLLADPHVRLVTILGPGGMGKTRLSLQVAAAQLDHFADGIYFVSLASISTPELLIPTIADVVRCRFYPGCEPKQLLLDFFRVKSLLLVLDNFEHLLTGVSLITEIINAAPDVKILTTSREHLHLRSETVFRLEGLAVPDRHEPTEVTHFGAVQLFVQTARHFQPEFGRADELSWAARICRQVSGMPLAIELAAAWVDTLHVSDISQEIEKSLDFLKTEAQDMPTRQRSIQAAFDSSWQRLTADERLLFMRLSVFRGGFTREAARQVAGASLESLRSLVSKSFLHRDPFGRFGVHELLRQYAESNLASLAPEFESARERHAVFYADFMEARWNPLRSRQARDAAEEIETELGNVRTAWQFMVERKRAADIRKFTRLFWMFLDQRNRFAEGIALLEMAVQALSLGESGLADAESELALGLTLAVQGNFYTSKGDPERARPLISRGLSLLRRYNSPDDTLIALIALWVTDLFLGNTEDLKRTAQQAVPIAKVAEDPGYIAGALYLWGVAHRESQEYEEALRIGEEALKFAEQSGDPFMVGLCSGLLVARTAYAIGDFEKARTCYLQSIEHFEDADRAYYVHLASQEVVPALAALGDFEEAHIYLRRALEFFAGTGITYQVIAAILSASILLDAMGQSEQAAELVMMALMHPALQRIDQRQAQRLLSALQVKFPPSDFAVACQRGKALDLDAVVTLLLQDA